MSDQGKKYQKVAYYPGCALEGTGHAYNRSTKEVGKALGLELEEVKNWNCCGAMEVKNIDPKVQTYLSSRVMSIAANEMGYDVVMAPCNGCYHNLKKAEYDLKNDEASRQVVDRISTKAGHETYQSGQVETIHALDWIKHGIGEEALKAKVTNSLTGLKIANYYGCMYTRPRHIFPEKDQGAGTEFDVAAAFHGRSAGSGGRHECGFPAQDRLLRRGAHFVRFGHVDQACAEYHPGRGKVGGQRDCHRMPDLPLRPRDAPDPGRAEIRSEDERQDFSISLNYLALRSACRRARSACKKMCRIRFRC